MHISQKSYSELFFKDFVTNPFSNRLTVSARIATLAFSILIAIPTLGILHISSSILRKKRIREQYSENYFANFSRFSDVKKLSSIEAPCSISNLSGLNDLNREKLGSIIQTELMGFYSKPLPAVSSVEVRVKGESDQLETKKWVELSKKEKVNLFQTHAIKPSQKISSSLPEFMIDRRFFGTLIGQKRPFISSDPKHSHGGDHAVRAALWAAVFAYLYDKYHPKYQVSAEEVLMAQFAAAGHDVARQSEGIDVYDEQSAEVTVRALERLVDGEVNKLLPDVYNSIAHKDEPNLEKKSLIAKCVQNADCVEYARLLLDSPNQDEEGFENSREFLDIYKEMNSIEMKEGFTVDDFRHELDAIRYEMNQFIFKTYQKAFREKASQSASYYDAMLAEISPANQVNGVHSLSSYPLLSHILKLIKVIP